MHSRLLLIFVFSLLYSCSLLKPAVTEPEILIDQAQLNTAVELSVDEIIKGEWLSAFMVKNNERPVVICSTIDLPPHVSFPIDSLYNMIDLHLIKTGQVRVIKSNTIQRTTAPVDLAKGESIDFVLTAAIEKAVQQSSSNPVLVLALWNENSETPITTAKNMIE
jgi:hypothetical protein